MPTTECGSHPGFYTVTVSTTDSLGNQVQGQILTTILY